jgi:hypothetical protein
MYSFVYSVVPRFESSNLISTSCRAGSEYSATNFRRTVDRLIRAHCQGGNEKAEYCTSVLHPPCPNPDPDSDSDIRS